MRQLKKNIWPYIALASKENTSDIESWCREFLGNKSHGWYLYPVDSSNMVSVAFKEKRDLLSFKLKWNTKND